LYRRIKEEDFVFADGSQQQQEVSKQYIDRISQDVKLQRPLTIAIDCGNGVTGVLAKDLFVALGCKVYELYCDVDGTFPNHHPDPSVAENLQDLSAYVIKHHCDIGIAFDGDGDRLGIVTDKGTVIYPDRQMMLYAQDVLSHEPGAVVIFDVKCSQHLSRLIEQQGGKAIMTKTGHSLIKAAMHEHHAMLAGEMSGHIFFQHRWYGFDDALYAAARILEIISQTEKSVEQLFAELPDSLNTPELKVMISDEKKFEFMQQFVQHAKFDAAELITVDGLRVEFSDGWGLLRASNTTPAVVLRFEADNEEALTRIQQQFKQQMLAVDKSLEIPF